MIGGGQIGLVCFGAAEGEGHISPLTGVRGARVLLPNTSGGGMEVAEFDERWREAGILRQLVLVKKNDVKHSTKGADHVQRRTTSRDG